MIKEEIELLNGATTTNLIPENGDDVERLRNMKGLDDRHSFADDPLMLPLESITSGYPDRQESPPFLERNTE